MAARSRERRCPHCGVIVDDPRKLVDHYYARHTGSAGRRAALFKIGRVAATAGVVLSVGLWAFLGVGLATGTFEKETASPTPGSVPAQVARELEDEGEIGGYRPIEPDDDWDVEYELDDPSGSIRMRGSGSLEEVEYETFDGDLDDAIREKLEERGFEFE